MSLTLTHSHNNNSPHTKSFRTGHFASLRKVTTTFTDAETLIFIKISVFKDKVNCQYLMTKQQQRSAIIV